MSAPPGPRNPACVWLISAIFFIFILAGGAFLALYLILPESQDTVWYPAVGMVLVGIPWIFWLMTCFYRFMKPAIGERQPPLRVATMANGATLPTKATAPAGDLNIEDPGSARKVRFGGVTTCESDGGDKERQRMDGEGGSEYNEESLASRDSERPLALSMT